MCNLVFLIIQVFSGDTPSSCYFCNISGKILEEDGSPFNYKYYGLDEASNKERYGELSKVSLQVSEI